MKYMGYRGISEGFRRAFKNGCFKTFHSVQKVSEGNLEVTRGFQRRFKRSQGILET